MEVPKKELKMGFTCPNGVPMRWLCPLLLMSMGRRMIYFLSQIVLEDYLENFQSGQLLTIVGKMWIY